MMSTSPRLIPITATTVVIALACSLLFFTSRFALETEIRQQLQTHLKQSLSSNLFANQQGRVNDRQTIALIGNNINQNLSDAIRSRWFSAQQQCQLQLLQIDDIVIAHNTQLRQLQWTLLRQQAARDIHAGYRCQTNYLSYLLMTLAIIVAAILYVRLRPKPLSKSQQRWREQLQTHGYSPAQALAAVYPFYGDRLDCLSQQQHCFDQWHDIDQKNFSPLCQVLTSQRFLALNDIDRLWFSLALNCHQANRLQRAWQLAEHRDSIEIDLQNNQLKLRGELINTAKTPLFYYAWYAHKRQQGEGWVLNPRSNKPEQETGTELAALMLRYKGHAKAVNDLEEHGLKAKTLDQNRSKLKEELNSSLGETLAAYYLFDSEKDSASGRMRYRLKASSEAITIHSP